MKNNPFIDFSIEMSFTELCLARRNRTTGEVVVVCRGLMDSAGRGSGDFLKSEIDNDILGLSLKSKGRKDVPSNMDFSLFSYHKGIPFLISPDAWAGKDSDFVLFKSARASSKRIVYIVATCPRYMDDTLERCVTGLAANGVEFKDIIVVCGSAAEDGVSVDDSGIRIISTSSVSAGGFTPLFCHEQISEAYGEFDYALLLNDTSAPVAGFVDKVLETELGLNPDTAPVYPPSCIDMGLFSWKIMMEMSEFEGKHVNEEFARNLLGFTNRMFTRLGNVAPEENPKQLGVRDVYGTGNQRKVVSHAVGLRKFSTFSGRKVRA